MSDNRGSELSREAPLKIECSAFAQHVVTRSREFVRERLDGDDAVGPGFLALVEAFGLRAETQCEVGRLDIRPRQILVAVFGIAFAFLLAVADVFAVDAATVGSVVADFGKTLDRSRLKEDDACQDGTDSRRRLQQRGFPPR